MKKNKITKYKWMLIFLLLVIIIFIFLKLIYKNNNQNESEDNNINENTVSTSMNNENEKKIEEEEENQNSNFVEKSNSNSNNEVDIVEDDSEEKNWYMAGNAGGIDINKLDNVKIVDGEKQNISKKLAEIKQFDGLEFSEIKLYSLNGSTELSAKVENKGKNDFKEKNLLIKFLNSDGSEMGNMLFYITDISSGGYTIACSSITEDYVNAYDIKIENVK